MKAIDKAIKACDKFKVDTLHFECLQIECCDPDGELKRLLDCIKQYTLIGHTFQVVVDPGDSEYEKKFLLDGDGSCRVQEVKFEKGVEK